MHYKLILTIVAAILLIMRIVIFFMRRKLKAATDPSKGAKIFSDNATHFFEDFIKGELFLYQKEIYFCSAPAHQYPYEISIALTDIKKVTLSTKGSDLRKELEIQLLSGEIELFKVRNGERWKFIIETQMGGGVIQQGLGSEL